MRMSFPSQSDTLKIRFHVGCLARRDKHDQTQHRSDPERPTLHELAVPRQTGTLQGYRHENTEDDPQNSN